MSNLGTDAASTMHPNSGSRGRLATTASTHDTKVFHGDATLGGHSTGDTTDATGESCSCGSNPCIDGTFGPTQPAGYWSATSYVSGPVT